MAVTPSSWTPDSVHQLLTDGPGERVAYAPGSVTPPRLAETLVALANAHGGVVVLGIGPNGKVQGAADPDAALATVQAAGLLSTPPLILPRPHRVALNDKTVYIAEVPAGLPHAYSSNGRYLSRTGAQNRLLSSTELAALLLARDETGFESRPAASATLTDLDMTQVESYLAALAVPAGEEWQRTLLARGALVGVARSETGHSAGETGHSTDTEGARGGGPVPTYAGVLLFGRQPQRFLRNAQLSLVRYAGATMGDEFLRQDATGTLPEQIRQAEAFVTANMRRGMRLSGFARQETTEYPMPVVREAIVNAVAHRDYAIRGDNIRVLMFERSAGGLQPWPPAGPRDPGEPAGGTLLAQRSDRAGVIGSGLRGTAGLRRRPHGGGNGRGRIARANLRRDGSGVQSDAARPGRRSGERRAGPSLGQPPPEPPPGARPGPSG